jgi:L-tryptophan--pyruvate aminotransferase
MMQTSGVLEPHHVLKKVSHEEERSNSSAVTLVDIDRTMKKYVDNLLHALEGVSSKLSQLEDRTYNLENSVGELKLTIGNNNGSTDGKLRQFENTLREVRSCCCNILPFPVCPLSSFLCWRVNHYFSSSLLIVLNI